MRECEPKASPRPGCGITRSSLPHGPASQRRRTKLRGICFVLVLSPSLCWGSAESCADGIAPGLLPPSRVKGAECSKIQEKYRSCGRTIHSTPQTRHQISGTDLAAGGWVSDRSGGRQPEMEKMGPPMRLYLALITVLCVIVLAANGLFGHGSDFCLVAGS